MSQQGLIYFLADEIYRETSFSGEVWDEAGVAHTIGHQGEEWFDKHFREFKDEEYLEFLSECYANIPNHDDIETKELQKSIEKQIEVAMKPYKEFYEYFKELYGTGLGIANWHKNGNLEPFDKFFESAERKMKLK